MVPGKVHGQSSLAPPPLPPEQGPLRSEGRAACWGLMEVGALGWKAQALGAREGPLAAEKAAHAQPCPQPLLPALPPGQVRFPGLKTWSLEEAPHLQVCLLPGLSCLFPGPCLAEIGALSPYSPAALSQGESLPRA